MRTFIKTATIASAAGVALIVAAAPADAVLATSSSSIPATPPLAITGISTAAASSAPVFNCWSRVIA